MGRPRTARPSLPLFPKPTRERAFELVRRFPLGSHFSQVFKKCQGACCKDGASHGPYWMVDVPRSAGKPRKRHVGTEEKKREIEAAWQLVSAELANAKAKTEALPQIRELRRLEGLAGRPNIARASNDEGTDLIHVYDAIANGRGRPKK
ncbi:MAG: hypothetical protein ACRENK_14720 [Gemmatimonadaceae bacterium]